ncbi:MAG TPA: cupin domain-containing protein [Tepidisphaeraceae bacterium]|jgi:mannose-6-phosphate isomerase-like protein (cupin superfamily)
MKYLNIARYSGSFTPLAKSAKLQAAMMSLGSGESSSEKVENEHPRAEQWLFVVCGSGRAMVGRKRVRLGAGGLLVIPRGIPHQIMNTGRGRLVTLNFYSPPAYTSAGNVKPSVSRLR